MEANHWETRAQAWDQKQPSKPTKHTQRKTLSKARMANTVKGRATRDADSNKRCNEMREQWEKKGDKTKSANRRAVLEIWKRAYKSD